VLGVDLVAAGCAIKGMPHWEGQLLLHLLEQTIKIKGRGKTTQLRPVEVSHLQCCCVGEVVNAEALLAQELYRCNLLAHRDVKEEAFSNSDSMQQAKKCHEHNGYGFKGRIEGIIVDVVCIGHVLAGKDERKKVSHC
jgi:hypothetical protein